MNLVDLLFFLLLVVCQVILVGRYRDNRAFSPEICVRIAVGGFLWLGYCLVSDHLLEFMFGGRMDAAGHEIEAMEMVRNMARGDWSDFMDHLTGGNRLYQAWNAIIFYSTGASVKTVNCINGFLAFWGGLVLAKELSGVFPEGRKYNKTILLIIFFPSVIFWTSANLKEGAMYWSICMVFSGIPMHSDKSWFLKSPAVLIGITVGALLRPHVMMAWAGSVMIATLLQKGRRSYAIIMLAALPTLAALTFSITGSEQPDPKASLDFAYKQLNVMQEDPNAGSNVEFVAGKPIFFVSGLAAIFLRPLPWEVRSGRMLFSGIETWITAFLIFSVWWKATNFERRMLLKIVEIRVSILACMCFAVFFTFFANDGLLVRQRVQVIPALLTLAFVPRWQLLAFRQEMKRRSILLRQQAARGISGVGP